MQIRVQIRWWIGDLKRGLLRISCPLKQALCIMQQTAPMWANSLLVLWFVFFFFFKRTLFYQMDFHTLINSILTVFVSRRQIMWRTTKQLEINGQAFGRGRRHGRKQPKLHFGWQQLHVGLNAALKVLSWLSIAAYSLICETGRRQRYLARVQSHWFSSLSLSYFSDAWRRALLPFYW